jgi:hypothetical protein
VIYIIDVADKLYCDRLPALCHEWQMFISNIIVILQSLERIPGGGYVLERTHLPDISPTNGFIRKIKQLQQEGVDIDHLSRSGIENQDAILGRFEEPTITLLRIMQRRGDPLLLQQCLVQERDALL